MGQAMADTGHGRIHVGTSGWNYPHWRESFYPGRLPQERWLAFYAERFATVEINNSFYNLPAAATFSGWAARVPRGFLFAVKASRYITHMKKLKDPGASVPRFLERAGHLGDRLGPILFQLPPRWKRNVERLQGFLRTLPPGGRYAFEFRDPSWFHGETYACLREAGAAFCIYHLAGTLSPKEVTAEFVYLRLHGPEGAYEGSYDTQALAGWAGALSAWSSQGREVFCYFDNDQGGYAPRDAARLSEMLG